MCCGTVFAIAVGQEVIPDGLGNFLTLVDLSFDLDRRVLHCERLDFSRSLHFKRYLLGKVVGPRGHHFAQRVGAGRKMFDTVRFIG